MIPMDSVIVDPKPTPSSQDAPGMFFNPREVRWADQFCQETLVFYIKPLLAKWMKAFKTPSILFFTDTSIEEPVWTKKLKVSRMARLPLYELSVDKTPKAEWELVVLMHPQPSEAELAMATRYLKRGGAFVMVSNNRWDHWERDQLMWERLNVADAFPVGFHPKGTVAWWPEQDGVFLPLGKFMNFVASFFPGRYTMGLWHGKRWVTRGLKRDDITTL